MEDLTGVSAAGAENDRAFLECEDLAFGVAPLGVDCTDLLLAADFFFFISSYSSKSDILKGILESFWGSMLCDRYAAAR